MQRKDDSDASRSSFDDEDGSEALDDERTVVFGPGNRGAQATPPPSNDDEVAPGLEDERTVIFPRRGAGDDAKVPSRDEPLPGAEERTIIFPPSGARREEPVPEPDHDATVIYRKQPEPPSEPPPAPTRGQQRTSKTLGNGRFECIERIGSGGTGTVYMAYDHEASERVAVKILGAKAQGPAEPRAFIEAFEESAGLLLGIDHPGIIKTRSFGRAAAGRPYVVTDLIQGMPLQSVLDAAGGLSWPEAVSLGAQIAEALHCAHENGLRVHGNLKPSNIFRVGPDEYKLGDFTSAGSLAARGARGPDIPAAYAPRLMAPEQILSPDEVGASADVFGVCAVLYECVAGRPAYRAARITGAGSDPESARTIVDAVYQTLSPLRGHAPEVPANVARVIERGLQKQPAHRHRDCGALAAALRRVAPGGRDKIRLALEIGLLSALSLAAYVFLFRGAPTPW